MAWDLMILMRLFWPKKARIQGQPLSMALVMDFPASKLLSLGPKKSRFQGPALPMALIMDLPASKSLSLSAI